MFCNVGNGADALRSQGYTWGELLANFVEEHFLGDEEMAAEMQSSRGAAHFDMDEYWVRVLKLP